MTDAQQSASSTGEISEHFARRLPRWQVLLILVGFPALYLANSFTPWSLGLFVENDDGYWIPFGLSLVLLHWLSVALIIVFVRRAGGRMREIGFPFRATGTVIFVGVVVAVGLALVGLRSLWPQPAELPGGWMAMYPGTQLERLWWILIALTAGFCEELVYRGFGIRILQGRGWRTWQAVGLATLSFVFIHGVFAFIAFPVLFVAGLFYAGIFLWRKSLAPGMYLHALFDVTAVLAV